MQLRPILLALSIMTMLLGGAMVPCALIDIADERAEWPVFAISAFGSVTFGALLYVLSRGDPPRTGQREAFLLTVLVWVVLPAIAAIPFVASGMTLTDAMFESISGLTTTGATVLTGLDSLPRGLLLWRAILQWIGGIGIIVTAIAILPQLRVGGMQLFQIESSDQSGKFMPRVTTIAMQTGIVYLVMSIACAILYMVTGMNPFEAIAHAMTTMAAGGYSTHDASFGFYGDTAAPWVAIVFMTIAGLPFALLAQLMLSGRLGPLLRDPQPRLYLGLIASFFLAILACIVLFPPETGFESPVRMVRDVLFSVISVMTGTGYATTSYDQWNEAATAIFLVIMFIGGCAGSAACGMKVFRIELSAKAVIAHSQRMVTRRRLAPVRYAGQPVEEDTLQSVMVFVFLYIATFLFAAALLGVMGMDTLSAISAAATSVSNVGPGLGEIIGPAGTFQTLDPEEKWVCAIAMLLGRLEFIAVFVVLTRRFWSG